MNELLLGIDPGKYGGIARMCCPDSTVKTWDIPVDKSMAPPRKGKTKPRKVVSYNKPDLLEILQRANRPVIGHVVIEEQQAFNDQGAVAGFQTGYGYGIYWGMLLGIGIPEERIEVVRPKAWQKLFGIRGDDTKEQAEKIALRLCPNLATRTERGRLLDGICDAFLLAEYGRMVKGWRLR